MRIIAGTARGVRLESPSGNHIRPTLDRVRESVFNILGDHVHDVAFLDMFAGTGAVGIEALSRGAKSAVFVDYASDQIALVQRNLAKANLSEAARLVRCKLPGQLGIVGGAYEIVYADPPRTFTDYQTLAEALLESGLIAKQGRFILETPKETILADDLGGLLLSDSRTYGDTRISIFT